MRSERTTKLRRWFRTRRADDRSSPAATTARAVVALPGGVSRLHGCDSAADLDAHTHIAAEFSSVVEQDLLALAGVLASRAGAAERHSIARTAGLLSRSLCGLRGSAPLARSVFHDPEAERLARRACARFGDLIRKATDAGGMVGFDFETGVGARMTQVQQPWSSCDPDSAVAFVVVPAYTVHGTSLSRQAVFTGDVVVPRQAGVHCQPRQAGGR